MFKNIIPVDHFATTIIIRRDKYDIALFHGDHILGQINSDLIKSCATSYDPNKREKTIILEV